MNVQDKRNKSDGRSTVMRIKLAKKINRNPSRYHAHQILKAETVARRAARRAEKKNA